MTQHPITPPLELVQEWHDECYKANLLLLAGADEPFLLYIVTRAAQWGADQELRACVAWLDGFDREGWAAEQLRAARRPKPLSLKEQALKDVDEILKNPGSPVHSDFDRIISALKSISDPS